MQMVMNVIRTPFTARSCLGSLSTQCVASAFHLPPFDAENYFNALLFNYVYVTTGERGENFLQSLRVQMVGLVCKTGSVYR